jgi:PTH2 family peptidyl-tRNA hydrolase
MDWPTVVSTTVIFGAGLIAGALLRGKLNGSSASGGSQLSSILNPAARKLKLAAIRASNPSRTHKVVMVVRTDLGMGKGKIAAQCAHAAVMCYQKALVTHERDLEIWEATGCTKICLKCDDGEEGLEALKKLAKERGLVAALVHDAGHTQVAAGSATVLGIGPAPSEVLGEITGKLKLL